MRSFIYSFASFNRVALILLILGRAPLLKVSSYVCVFGKQMVQHVWKVVAPTLISVGPINAQTGATDEVIELDLAPGFDDTTGFVGEHLDVRVLADGFVPQSYTVN